MKPPPEPPPEPELFKCPYTDNNGNKCLGEFDTQRGLNHHISQIHKLRKLKGLTIKERDLNQVIGYIAASVESHAVRLRVSPLSIVEGVNQFFQQKSASQP